MGGNIGVPLSEQVDDSTPDTLHVVEASSFQLEATDTFHPWIAALLNFSPDHLDRHPTIEAYAAAKARIFANQTRGRLGGRERRRRAGARRWRADATARRRSPTGSTLADDGFTVADDAIVERRGGRRRPLVPLSAVQVPGRHILSDVVAAAADQPRLAGATARGDDGARSRRFRGLEHAMELVGDDRRRAVRERLEGDQRRVGAAVDRERCDRAWSRSWAAATRAASSRICATPLRRARRVGGGDRRSGAAESSARWRRRCR